MSPRPLMSPLVSVLLRTIRARPRSGRDNGGWGQIICDRHGPSRRAPRGSGWSNGSFFLSFFPSPSLVELKSDRGKSGAGLWPGRLGSQRLGRFLLEEPGMGPRGAEVGHPGNGRFVSGQSREGANCRGGAGGGGGPGEPNDT